MNAAPPDQAYQDEVLPLVSRTFALTIPQLPQELRTAVTNAYLLCRIADTIEDDPAISPADTLAYLERFQALMAERGDPAAFAAELAQRLSERTLPAERELVVHIPQVLRVFFALAEGQRAAIQRCVERMCYGMPRFQATASLRGLARISDMDDYCYFVAGIVGEMLTDLFCEYSPEIAQRRTRMQQLAASFGQGLQMTNILKDVWEDRSRGACWLPREVFQRHGIDLERLAPDNGDGRVAAAFRELIGVAHAHLRNALDYTLLLPPNEAGIRRFCLWALGLAVLTLRKIEANPRFAAGAEVKVSRRSVAMVRLLTDVFGRSDFVLRRLFALAAGGLPLAAIADANRPHSAPALAQDRAAPDAHGSIGMFGT